MTLFRISFCLIAGLIAVFNFLVCSGIEAQPMDANYDEAKVPLYSLPDPLITAKGRTVTSARQWTRERRPEILRLFEENVYGRTPTNPPDFRLAFSTTSVDSLAINGTAIRKEVTVLFSRAPDAPRMRLLVFLPKDAPRPVPVFVGLNFDGNHTIHTDPGITLPTVWSKPGKDQPPAEIRALAETRGSSASRWQLEKLLSRGYGLVTAWYGDIEPDFPEGWKHGVRGKLFGASDSRPRQGNEWGAIGAWAWGLSRAMDYIEYDHEFDSKRVALIGHSRLGKTALWAGAQDQRFDAVISNDSGEGGAALSRRQFGETVKRINTSFPHWFCDNYKKFNDRVPDLPVDQHMLIALIAPRPVYVASAAEDLWADPRGEFLAAKHAEPVYALFGRTGLEAGDMPGVNQPVGDYVAYHIRTGKHDVTEYDWDQYLNFTRRQFGR